ncbi:hypothetical protein RJ639_034199 [Escallonia herrerae]|uniref:Uncharacterized protein n=1 Tax=Escallonia herrerae TaxID=1293975 RepID=A0AA88WUE2_9ASTE|nr:hypothetical protein RJ639_034199 [Escallonia herrerae]
MESKKFWYLAGPAIFIGICLYSLDAVTQTFACHVSTLALATFSIENSIIACFSFDIMLGMGNALETLCGQACGAGQLDMLGSDDLSDVEVFRILTPELINDTTVSRSGSSYEAPRFLRL